MKLHKVKLKNVLSHKEVEIELSPTLTVFEGESDHGKTNIVRGMIHNMRNEPPGADLLSNSAKRGENAEITLYGTDPTGEPFKAARIRGRSTNVYVINDGDPLTVGRGQPEEIDKLLNLSPHAIHRQQDGHFLLDEKISDGEIARVIGTAIGLDAIDSMFAYIRSHKSANDASLRAAKVVVENETAALDKYDGIDDCTELMEELSELTDKHVGMHKELSHISELLGEYDKLRPDMSKEITELESTFSQLAKLSDAEDITRSTLYDIGNVIEQYEGLSEDVTEQLQELSRELEVATTLANAYMSKKADLQALHTVISDYEGIQTVDSADLDEIVSLMNEIESDTAELARLKKTSDDMRSCIISLRDMDKEVLSAKAECAAAQVAYESYLKDNPVCPECGAKQEHWDT